MGYGKYQAKATNYHGTWFRSNLEARVAQAFDRLQIAWEYERQCFRDERFPYDQFTPDFHLPANDIYVEVCSELDERHRANVRVLCEIVGSVEEGPTVAVVDGSGTLRDYWVADGRLMARRAKWPAIGGTTDNVFEAAGMRRY
jgi:hypothetical protein